MKGLGWFGTAFLAGTLCAVSGQAQAACTGGSSTCAGPPPTVNPKPMQPYVTPSSGSAASALIPKSGVTQPSSIPTGDSKILSSSTDSCYALGENSNDYTTSGGTDYVAVCKTGYTLAGKMAASTTHTCGTGTYTFIGLTCPLYPVPTISVCGGGTEAQYTYGGRNDAGTCPSSPSNTAGYKYDTNQADTQTVTTVDPTTATLMCCPVVNQTKKPN